MHWHRDKKLSVTSPHIVRDDRKPVHRPLSPSVCDRDDVIKKAMLRSTSCFIVIAIIIIINIIATTVGAIHSQLNDVWAYRSVCVSVWKSAPSFSQLHRSMQSTSSLMDYTPSIDLSFIQVCVSICVGVSAKPTALFVICVEISREQGWLSFSVCNGICLWSRKTDLSVSIFQICFCHCVFVCVKHWLPLWAISSCSLNRQTTPLWGS